jgi:hypothetical protein
MVSTENSRGGAGEVRRSAPPVQPRRASSVTRGQREICTCCTGLLRAPRRGAPCRRCRVGLAVLGCSEQLGPSRRRCEVLNRPLVGSRSVAAGRISGKAGGAGMGALGWDRDGQSNPRYLGRRALARLPPSDRGDFSQRSPVCSRVACAPSRRWLFYLLHRRKRQR